MKPVAYDYERQQWVKGPRALELLRKQEEQRLELLRGPHGQEYLDAIGDPRPQEEVIAEAVAILESL